MKIKIIANPVGGRQMRKKLIPKVEKELKRRNADYDLQISQTPGASIQIARDARDGGYDVIVAMGGDGTINEVINGLAGADIPIGIIPAGTGNDLARHLGISNDIDQAIDILLRGKTKIVDLAKVGDRFFINVAGIGLDVTVCKDTDLRLKRLAGPAAYFLSSLRTKIMGKQKTFYIELEAEKDFFAGEVHLIAICNGRAYGSGLFIGPDAEMDDGLFDVCIFEKMSYLQLMSLQAKATSNKDFRGHPKVKYFKTPQVKIHQPNELEIETDGEVFPYVQPTFSILKDAAKLVVP